MIAKGMPMAPYVFKSTWHCFTQSSSNAFRPVARSLFRYHWMKDINCMRTRRVILILHTINSTRVACSYIRHFFLFAINFTRPSERNLESSMKFCKVERKYKHFRTWRRLEVDVQASASDKNISILHDQFVANCERLLWALCVWHYCLQATSSLTLTSLSCGKHLQ